MAGQSDLTFITNEKGQTLLDRFQVLIRDTEAFDVLVGYFYTSGFHALYESLEATDNIRILIGISTDRQIFDQIGQARREELSKKQFAELTVAEMESAEDSQKVEDGVKKFIEWLQSSKLEIRAYPSANIHAKVYIMTFPGSDRDAGRVITGSSNFTQAGLVDNFEFNTELKGAADYDYAKQKFEELWQKATDVKKPYIETVTKKTWLRDDVGPYELYLKCLYEYFKDELSQPEDILTSYEPTEFKRLEYQTQAVLNAKKIVKRYGGVFISDVVGLGKTYVSAMLARQLGGRTLVIAPPALLDHNNPGSWPRVFADFNLSATTESLGKLDQLMRRGIQYDNVFIDEAHRFRTESNVTYEKLAQICRGKRVILVTATPFNNSPRDILSQIKLFQNTKRSSIPGMTDLEAFFRDLEKRFKDIDRQTDRDLYLQVAKENAQEIRNSVLKHLMVRRTRTEIETYFADDLQRQGLTFPAVQDPQAVYYQLSEAENAVFDRTVKLITREFHYARYTPMLYYRGDDKLDQLQIQSQKNLSGFMKILLIKRLESSFYAFQKSIERFIATHELFLTELEGGNVYISKEYSRKIFELLESEDEDAIQRLLDSDRAHRYSADDFTDQLKADLTSDLATLREIQQMWQSITRDPKLIAFVKLLQTHPPLNQKQSKPIVFTESKETADYLATELTKEFGSDVLAFTGASSAAVREKVIANFDAKAHKPQDAHRILITTEVLSEGVNLHRSNIVINYDIPWNPTRLMQRVGRVNRLDTSFSEIHTFNFFPTDESDDQLHLRSAAEAKIQAFITLLGADARLLTDGEDIESHELFSKLTSKQTIMGEETADDSELKYLQVIRAVRADEELFERIKNLPKKARTAKRTTHGDSQLLTYFRKGSLQKFFTTANGKPTELDFISAAKLLECSDTEKRVAIPADFYDKIDQNKQAFTDSTTEDASELRSSGANSAEVNLFGWLKAIQNGAQVLTDKQESELQLIIDRLQVGGLPKQTVSTALKAIKKEITRGNYDTLKLLAIVQLNIPSQLLNSHIAESAAHTAGPREVILSEYLVND